MKIKIKEICFKGDRISVGFRGELDLYQYVVNAKKLYSLEKTLVLFYTHNKSCYKNYVHANYIENKLRVFRYFNDTRGWSINKTTHKQLCSFRHQ